jgi:hypothetical protein
MISSLEDKSGIARCIELGADDFLRRPADPADPATARVNAGLTKRRVAELEHRRVRDVFSRFLPETVVDEVAGRDRRRAADRGQAAHGTVMFNDLRGFTTFAETCPVDQVIAVLNRLPDRDERRGAGQRRHVGGVHGRRDDERLRGAGGDPDHADQASPQPSR